MRCKKLTLGVIGGMLLYSMAMATLPATISPNIVVKAEELGDDVEVDDEDFFGDDESESESSDGDESEDESEGESVNDNGVNALLKNYEGMTSKQLSESAEKVAPITNMFGYIMGVLITLVTGGIFVITVLDLAYMAIPPLRGVLYKGGGAQQMGGQQQGIPFQLISDEAVQCAALIGGGGSPAQPQVNPMGGYGGGYGMPQQGAQGSQTTKSVIFTYFKKRVFFMILFAICASMLTTSLFLGTGINLAQWFTKLVEMVNNSIPH